MCVLGRGAFISTQLPNTHFTVWKKFLEEWSKHVKTLDAHYLQDDERCRRRMENFRRKRRALDRVAGTAIKKKERHTPIVIGMGNANVSATIKGTKMSVPTKGIQKAMHASFKKHSKRGYMMKVWEARTTMTCYRCNNEMEKLYLKDEEGNYVRHEKGYRIEDRDFRLCNTCTYNNKPTKRNRDFNAAKNILHVFLNLILGLNRPAHLCTRRRD